MLVPSFCPRGDSNGLRLLRITQDKLRLQERKISALQLPTDVFKKSELLDTSSSASKQVYFQERNASDTM